MNRKIELAKKKKEILARQQELTAKEIKARQSLLDATKKLYDLINGQEQYDFTKLEKQLEKIDKSLDLSKYFTNLERSIKDNSPHAQVTKTKIQDFSKLLEAIAKNKPIPLSIDLTRLEKAVVNIERYIQDNSKPSDQGAENYQPVRRVLKIGNRFIFDDNFTNSGGGGSGGGSTGGNTTVDNFPTEYPLPAAQVTTLTPPAAITGFATATKQDTGNTSLSSIDGKLTDVATQTTLALIKAKTDNIPAQGQALAAASTPVVLPAAQITTLTPPAAITGFATSAKQDTAQTALDAIKTSVETLDNAISGSEMQVDVVGALPAGTNAIGKLAANSGVDIGDVDVTSAVSATLDHGSNLDIDTSAEQITSTSFACKFGVTLKAAATNTGTLYIGDSSSVTAGTTGSTDGFPLEPGESVTLPVNNPNLLYAIASVANQKIFWVAT